MAVKLQGTLEVEGALVDPPHTEVGLGEVLLPSCANPLGDRRPRLDPGQVACPSIAGGDGDGVIEESDGLPMGEAAQRLSARPAQVSQG